MGLGLHRLSLEDSDGVAAELNCAAAGDRAAPASSTTMSDRRLALPEDDAGGADDRTGQRPPAGRAGSVFR